MGRRVDEFGRGVYRGVWRVLADWLEVPRDPVTLPARNEADAAYASGFRPDPAFLRYLRATFWMVAGFVGVCLVAMLIIMTFATGLVGAIVGVAGLLVFLGIAGPLYVARHLRYDTTWYAMNDRSLRIRRGVFVLRETSITFENVQNVTISRGPLEQYFGFGRVVVETAGGSSGEPGGGLGSHVGVIEGVIDPEALRDIVMRRVRASQDSGLGDESSGDATATVGWSESHIEALRAVRDEARRLAGVS